MGWNLILPYKVDLRRYPEKNFGWGFVNLKKKKKQKHDSYEFNFI